MTREEARRTATATLLLADLGVKSGLYITHRVVHIESQVSQGTVYAQGLMFTKDFGNQTYTAWLTHVRGDAIVATRLKGATVIGNIVEAIMGLCQLCIARPKGATDLMGMHFGPRELHNQYALIWNLGPDDTMDINATILRGW